MIAALIRWSARNVFLVGFASLFLTLAGLYAVSRVPLDAIPDLSDVQVIVYTEFPGQAPQVVEDQVTYPLTTAMLSVPKSRVVRGFSFFGVSFVYVIFEEGTDLYWARSRVLEYLSSAARRLPTGVAPSLGPDATGVGWVYQYVVRGAQKSLAELRTIQDWYIRYGIAKAEGVAEVAGVGGFVKQYSVVIDPRRLQALGIPLSKVREALRASNMDVGGRTVELAETEFAVRGRGYLRGLTDLEQIVVKNDRGVPVLLKDVARVELTPDERRGIAELNGEGDEVAKVNLAQGPATIRTENAQLAVYIYVDLRDRDLGGFVADAQRAVADQVKFPPGTYVIWSGQFEYLQRAKARLQIVVPLTALIIFLLLYLNFRRVAETLIVMLSVPFALAGGFWLMWWLGFNLSVAAAVGFIALAGVAAETGCGDADLSRPCLPRTARSAPGRGRVLDARRPPRCGDGRCGRARTAEDDDGRCHHGGFVADHVESRHRCGSDAAHRGADDRRHGVIHAADPDRDPGDLCGGERSYHPQVRPGPFHATTLAKRELRMGFYGNCIVPTLIDLSMRNKHLRPYRERVAGAAEGRVLEIGIGSGLNLPFYARRVEQIFGLDPSPRLLARVRRKAQTVEVALQLLTGSAERIPLADRSIDTIITTWTACSIPDIASALAEMRRVLKPRGRLLFVEHGRAPEPSVARWQDRLTPLWRRVSGGCHLNRKIDDLIGEAGFGIDRLETGYIPGPRPMTFLYEGAAIPR